MDIRQVESNHKVDAAHTPSGKRPCRHGGYVVDDDKTVVGVIYSGVGRLCLRVVIAIAHCYCAVDHDVDDSSDGECGRIASIVGNNAMLSWSELAHAFLAVWVCVVGGTGCDGDGSISSDAHEPQ